MTRRYLKMNKRFFPFLCLLLIFQNQSQALPSITEDYSYWVARLNGWGSIANTYAEKNAPEYYIPNLANYISAYDLLSTAYLVYQGKKTPNLNLKTGVTLKALKLGSTMVGFKFPGLSDISFAFSAYKSFNLNTLQRLIYPRLDSDGAYLFANKVYNYTGQKISSISDWVYQPITVKADDPLLSLDKFKEEEPVLGNIYSVAYSTYLSCSLRTLNDDSSLSKFVEREDLPELENKLPEQYYNNHVIIYGRWVKINKTYMFATIESPAKIQEACMRKFQAEFMRISQEIKDDPHKSHLQNYFLKYQHILYDPKNINKYLNPTAGNFKDANNYPILFYLPLKDGQMAIRLAGEPSHL